MFDKKRYDDNWRKDNKDKIKKYNKQWKENNKEYNKQYQINNYKKIREWNNQYRNTKRKINLKFNLNRKISTAIWYSLKGNKAGRHWETLVGYTLNDLIKRLKKTIPKNYTWNDYLQGKLHIDHIIPVTAFNFKKPEHIDFGRCWSLDNLQLLPARENLIKSNHLIKPFQPTLKLEFSET
jgi:hypothetical protein